MPEGPKITKTSGLNIGEETDKCCFVVDLKTGVWIIGILIVLQAA